MFANLIELASGSLLRLLADQFALSLPPALNQSHFSVIGVVRIIMFTGFFSIMVYFTAFVTFLLFTSLFMRRSVKTLFRASIPFGVAVWGFVATMYCVVVVHGKIGEVLEGCLMIAVWIAAFVVGIRILRRGDRSSVGRVL